MKIKIIQKIMKETEVELPEKYIEFDGYCDEITEDGFYDFIYPLIEENGTLVTVEDEKGTIYYDG